jgi:hypothetical protein
MFWPLHAHVIRAIEIIQIKMDWGNSILHFIAITDYTFLNSHFPGEEYPQKRHGQAKLRIFIENKRYCFFKHPEI